jgi:carotenoid 1,2-hydratase
MRTGFGFVGADGWRAEASALRAPDTYARPLSAKGWRPDRSPVKRSAYITPPSARVDQAGAFRFDRPVPPGGYGWWYVDALSDDLRHGLTVIAFVGSVFSPYYAWARRGGRRADPAAHCSVNVALYGAAGKRWAMTERGRKSVQRSADSLSIGPSALSWDGNALTIRIDEITAPIPSRLRGVVRLYPSATSDRVFDLDCAARHHWRPIAPCARVEVDLQSPGLSWAGPAYADSNWGDEPLETAFSHWNWSRASLGKADTGVLYDITRRDGQSMSLAVRYAPSGDVSEFEPPAPTSLPRTLWRMPRKTRSDDPAGTSVIKTLEDSPFYSRSALSSVLMGEPVTAIHESLSLDSFSAPWMQAMLPFRMPRALW